MSAIGIRLCHRWGAHARELALDRDSQAWRPRCTTDRALPAEYQVPKLARCPVSSISLKCLPMEENVE